MKVYQNNQQEHKNEVNEDPVQYGYADQEEKRLQEALKRTDTEKFHFLMSLMKMGSTMKKAVIHHKQ